jgi:hypothetical protein
MSSKKTKRNKGGPRSQQALATDSMGAALLAAQAKQKLEVLTDKMTRSKYVEEVYEIEDTRPQRDIILMENTETLDDLLSARAWEYKKWFYFATCFLCNIVGIGLCLASFGATVLFAQFPKSTPLLVAGVLCFIPFFIWIKVIFFPHGENKIHLKVVAQKRALRRKEEKARRDHLAGRLPRPLRVEEDPTLPFEYDPDEPWMYNRLKEKPKLRVWYDDDGIAHKIEPGSLREAQALKEEEELAKIRAGTLGEAVGGRADGGKESGASDFADEGDYDEMEEGRMSSIRRSSAEDNFS